MRYESEWRRALREGVIRGLRITATAIVVMLLLVIAGLYAYSLGEESGKQQCSGEKVRR